MTQIIVYQKNNKVKFLPAPQEILDLEALLAEHEIENHILIKQNELPDLSYQDFFIFEEGILSVDLDKAKKHAHNIRRATIKALYAPYDNVFLQVYALKIPAERYSADQEQALVEAENRRQQIYDLSQVVKEMIEQAEDTQDLTEALELLHIC